MIDQDFRGDTAQVRRLAHHMQHGGKLRKEDIDYCVRVCEQKDNVIQNLLNTLARRDELIDGLHAVIELSNKE